MTKNINPVSVIWRKNKTWNIVSALLILKKKASNNKLSYHVRSGEDPAAETQSKEHTN